MWYWRRKIMVPSWWITLRMERKGKTGWGASICQCHKDATEFVEEDFYCMHLQDISVPRIWKKRNYLLKFQQSIQLPSHSYCVPESLGYPVWHSEGHGCLLCLVPFQSDLYGCLSCPRSPHMALDACVKTTLSIPGCLDSRDGLQLGKCRGLLSF